MKGHFPLHVVQLDLRLLIGSCALQQCGVTDYAFGTASENNLAGVYKQAAPAGCQLAVCARFADAVSHFLKLNNIEIKSEQHLRPLYVCNVMPYQSSKERNSVFSVVIASNALDTLQSVQAIHASLMPSTSMSVDPAGSQCHVAAHLQYQLILMQPKSIMMVTCCHAQLYLLAAQCYGEA